MTNSEKMKKIHIWIGITKMTNSKYKKYFELDYSTEGDFDDPEYKVCGFCKDLKIKWYDEDMIGIIPILKKEGDIDTVIKLAPINKKSIDEIKKLCAIQGIIKSNAILYYTDAELKVNKPYKDNYNDLKYIGCFNSSL